MKHLLLWGLAATVLLVGCGKENSSNSAAMNEPLNGKIAGRAWKFQFGTVRLSKTTNRWTFMLLDIAPGQDPCNATYNVGDTLYIVNFSTERNSVGEYDTKTSSGRPVSLTKMVTNGGAGFSSSSQGAFGDTRITRSDAASVEGQLDVKGNDDNYVKGKFTAKVCK